MRMNHDKNVWVRWDGDAIEMETIATASGRPSLQGQMTGNAGFSWRQYGDGDYNAIVLDAVGIVCEFKRSR